MSDWLTERAARTEAQVADYNEWAGPRPQEPTLTGCDPEGPPTVDPARACQESVSPGGRVRQRRRLCGFQQRELGRKIGTSETYLSQIELGRRALPWSLAVKLAPALETSPEWLMQGDQAGNGDRVRALEIRVERLERILRKFGVALEERP